MSELVILMDPSDAARAFAERGGYMYTDGTQLEEKVRELREHEGRLVIQNIDGYTLKRIMELEGKNPEESRFWNDLSYIEKSGQDRKYELDRNSQDRINAFFAAKEKMMSDILSQKADPMTGLANITEYVKKLQDTVEVTGKKDDPEKEIYLDEGRKWEEKRIADIEQQTIADTHNVKVLFANKELKRDMFFSAKDNDIKRSAVVYDARDKRISVIPENKRSGMEQAEKTARTMWGKEAVIEDDRAKSPNGMEMTEKDLVETVRTLEHNISPAPKQAIDNRVRKLEAELVRKPLLLRFIEPNAPGRKLQVEAVKKNPSIKKYIRNPVTNAEIIAFSESTSKTERNELDTENRARSEQSAQLFPDGVMDELEGNGLAYVNENLCVLVKDSDDRIFSDNKDEKTFELKDREFSEFIAKAAPIKYDDDEHSCRIYNMYIVMPVRDNGSEKDKVNLYEVEARVQKEKAAQLEKDMREEEERKRLEAEKREEERKKIAEKRELVLKRILEGVAIGVALDAIEKKIKAPETMQDVSEYLGIRSSIKEKTREIAEKNDPEKEKNKAKNKEKSGMVRTKI